MVPPTTPVSAHAEAYTSGGAAILSVLTEPTWFKGTLEDMEAARLASATTAAAAGGEASRPVILRKDFIVEDYQILEARAHGADTLLLIVSSLPSAEVLEPLITSSRALGMEPLVEVNSVDEMRVAMAAGARCVGINNRNLRTFKVDMGATTSVVAFAASECARTGCEPPALLSLSGIRSAEDIAALTADCVAAAAASGVPRELTLRLMRGFLVGEAIMRAPDARAMVRELVDAAAKATTAAAVDAGAAEAPQHAKRVWTPAAAKVCGVKSVAGAMAACRAGADFVGIICVGGSPRCVDAPTAAVIVDAVRAYREQDPSEFLARARVPATAFDSRPSPLSPHVFTDLCDRQAALRAGARRARPLVCGVFMNQPLEEVRALASSYRADVIQLHGDEDPEQVASAGLPCPLVKVMHVPVLPDGATDVSEATVAAVAARVIAWAPHCAALLLDTKITGAGSGGGTGAGFDATAFLPALESALSHALVSSTSQSPSGAHGGLAVVPLMLAGGLTPANVAERLAAIGSLPLPSPSVAHRGIAACVWAVDVSSGVEYDTGAAPPGAQGRGHKDPAKVDAYVKAAKVWSSAL